jgi:excisionase family DNA binding protein
VRTPTPPPDEPARPPGYDWLSPTQAAERLGITLRAVYRLIDRGVLVGYRIDGQIRLLAHEVDAVAPPPADGPMP